jgi:multiple sugar transport system substrate-binding protein
MDPLHITTMMPEEPLRKLLLRFEKEKRIQVKIETLQWESARQDLNRIAMYGQGADISEVGTTWTNDLIGMNALRSLSPINLIHMGGQEAFVPASWTSCRLPWDNRVWAIPWRADVLAIHYRRDLLAKAGVDEATAFTSVQGLTETVIHLKEIGLKIPIALPMGNLYGNLHALSSFIWSFGGDILDVKKQRVTFDDEKALAGIQAFYELLHYIDPAELPKLLEDHYRLTFVHGEAAMIFDTMALPFWPNFADIVKANLGVASLPGGSFVGGSNLVIWKHSRQEERALELVQYLTGQAFQTEFIQPLSSIPARLSALPAFTGTSHLHGAAQKILTAGRSWPSLPLFGTIEDRLMYALFNIWQDYLNDQKLDITEAIRDYLLPLAKRLNITLSQYQRQELG